jgi:hypothetical protein
LLIEIRYNIVIIKIGNCSIRKAKLVEQITLDYALHGP